MNVPLAACPAADPEAERANGAARRRKPRFYGVSVIMPAEQSEFSPTIN